LVVTPKYLPLWQVEQVSVDPALSKIPVIRDFPVLAAIPAWL
jgi:hypothetical protein